MRKFPQSVKAFIRNSFDCLAPYTVYNVEMRKEHFCWSLKEVFDWLACYDAESFGITEVRNFNGEVVAAKK